MATQTVNLERERLLQLAEDYRNKGYEISLQPNSEDLPDFLQNYRPDMIARRENEAVVIEVKSRRSLGSSPRQYLQNLAQSVAQHPGWRFELVMTNSEDTASFHKAEGSLQQPEIETRLQVARHIATQNLESALLYSWSLVEATLRLVTEHEELSLQTLDPLYLVKQLVTEGVISRLEYQLLMDALSSRNAIAHGFKATQVSQETIYELIDVTEQMLKTLPIDVEID